VSIDGGREPVWSPTASELFYRTIDGRGMMAVAVKRTVSVLETEPPRLLFEGTFPIASSNRNYDVSPDGQRFLMIQSAAAEGLRSEQIQIVLNWFEELKRLAPRN
jgi:hypothetical protein